MNGIMGKQKKENNIFKKMLFAKTHQVAVNRHYSMFYPVEKIFDKIESNKFFKNSIELETCSCNVHVVSVWISYLLFNFSKKTT